MRAKPFRNILIVVILLATIGGGIMLWLKLHRENTKADLLTKISADADIAVIYWDALSQLKDSKKVWRFPDRDTTNDIARIISSPLAMGIDISINPVLFQNPNDSSFQLVLSLLDKEKFELWLTEKAGQAWNQKIDHQPNFDVCSFENQRFAFVYDKHFALLVSNEKWAGQVGMAFFNSSKPVTAAKITLPERKSKDELITVRLMRDVPVFRDLPSQLLKGKTIHISIHDNQIIAESEGVETKKFANQLVWDSDVINSNFRPTKLLRELWNVGEVGKFMLDGKWQLRWKGYGEKELVYSSYYFDDNFNRVMQNQTILECYPELAIRFIPKRRSQLDSLKAHLVKSGFLKNNKLLIGPYTYKFSEQNGNWIIGDGAENEFYSDILLGVNFEMPELLNDFSKLKIPMGHLDTLVSNNLKMIDIQLGTGHFQTKLSTIDECPYHILAILTRLFKA